MGTRLLHNFKLTQKKKKKKKKLKPCEIVNRSSELSTISKNSEISLIAAGRTQTAKPSSACLTEDHNTDMQIQTL